MDKTKIRILSGISFIGSILVSYGNSLVANAIWGFVNPLIAAHNYKIGEKEQALLVAGNAIVAWFGVIHLWR